MNQKELSQYFTPRYAAEAIVEHHFPHLSAGHIVVEPSCGDGRFLRALPKFVRAIGVEIDPAMAQRAREATDCEVITGDFLKVDLPTDIDAVIGNPPFKADLVSAFLDRAHVLLREGGQCGLILPAYVLQTSSKVMAMNEKWSICQQLMPRNIFPGLSVPIVFAMFTKEQQRRLFGFFLYEQAASVATLAAAARKTLTEGREDGPVEHAPSGGSVWREAVNQAFDLINADTAPLAALYQALESRRPTRNLHYREKVRQTLQTYPEFRNVDRGLWARTTVEAEIAA